MNDEFEKKYGQKAKELNSNRTQTESNKKELKTFQGPESPQEKWKNVENELSNSGSYYSYIDVGKAEGMPKDFLPNSNVFKQSQGKNPSDQLPQDLFEISYNTNLHPAFKLQGIEFDYIPIPESDSYGVSTLISEKPYLIVGNKVIQSSISQITKNRTDQDIKNSEILIREQKNINKQRKMRKLFNRNEERSNDELLVEKNEQEELLDIEKKYDQTKNDKVVKKEALPKRKINKKKKVSNIRKNIIKKKSQKNRKKL
jgi:hypothetical protein